MQRLGSVVLLAAVMMACGTGSGGGSTTQSGVTLMPGFNPGPAPDSAKGFQIITPIVDDIAPGASDEYCTWTNMILDKDIWIDASQGFQTETGHHVILFYDPTPKKPQTSLCNFEDMAEFQFGMPASGGPGTGEVSLPGNLAVKLPKGSQIIVNHHYLNATAQAVPRAQSAIDVFYADPSVAHTTSSGMTILDTAMTVPPGSSKLTIDCTVNQQYASWMFFPHMHNWGTHITITDTPANGTTRQLVDMDWQADYAFDFNTVATMNSPSAPFMFNPGDKIHVECDYLNTTGSPMSFGDEMCVLNAFTVDTKNIGAWDCNSGIWGKY
jgi:hypothetical protein